MSEEIKKSNETPPVPERPKMADCSPAGLVALAVACFCFFPLLTGLVDGEKTFLLMGCWLAGCTLVQFTTAIVDLKNKNQLGGSTFLFFSGFFCLTGALGMLAKAGAFGAETLGWSSKIDGWAWIALGIAVLLWTPAFFKAPGQLFLICVFLDIAVPFIVMNDLGVFAAGTPGYQAFGIIAGVCLLICGILGLWLASATIVNNAYGRNVYPTLKPFYNPKNKE